jgi:hypothetical protein
MGAKLSESFRFITPVLVTITLAVLSHLAYTVGKIDDKLFKHFTNEEIHIPRSTVVTQAEFDMQCKFYSYANQETIKKIDSMQSELSQLIKSKR